MAAVSIPQVVTEDSASGAQVIDSSLKFDKDKQQYLTRTPSTAGNLETFTWSVWLKRGRLGDEGSSDVNHNPVFCAGNSSSASTDWRFQNSSSSNEDEFWWINWDGGSTYFSLESTARYRDLSGFYHLVCTYDGTTAKVYINGSQVTAFNTNTQNGGTSKINSTSAHSIGCFGQGALAWFDGRMSQFYLIDGQALDASYFGYTDLLTNTWRPKKYTGDYNITAGGDEIVSGATLLTWDDSPIGSVYTLSNSDKTATAGGGSSGYANADVWSIAIPANTTYAWTLDITNGDSTGGWYFTDSQTASGTHADERGGNSCGLRGGETSMGTHGTFATANGTSSGQAQITVNSAVSPNGTKKIDFVVYRPSSGDGKVWIRGYGASSWLGGGDPTNTSSTATFAIPDGTTYFGMTAYDRSSDQVLTFDALGTAPTGVNSFYLPLDGSGPIGRDQSPNANDWAPVNFGGSTIIPKATGALPILNTQNGGKVATPGIRGQVGIAVTVFDSGSGDKFYLDGVETLSLEQYRGQTVTFDLSDSTCASHPLRLSTTSDGTHDSGTEYSEGKQEGGTPGSVGAATTITYPYTAADTLYYYCPNHSAMGGSVELSTDIQKADPYAWRNVLALPLVGNATDVGIACTSTAKAVTVSGATADTSVSNFYGGSYNWDGSNDKITIAPTNASDFTCQNDFTIEGWIYVDAFTTADAAIFSNWDVSSSAHRSLLIGPDASGADKWTFMYNTTGAGGGWVTVANPDATPYLTKWTHIAYSYDHSTTTHRAFVDGVLVGSNSAGTAYNNSGANLLLGINAGDASGYFDGKMQDVRYYHTVKYTEDFIPASTNTDILPDTPSGIAYGSNLTKVTDGAVSFDGSSSYLSVDHSTDFDLTNGDFTLEGYFNHNHTSGYITGCGVWREASGADYWSYDLRMTQGGTVPAFIWTTDGTTVSGTLSATTSTANSGWHHIAVTRSGTSLRIFVDGVLEASTTTSDTFNTASEQPFICGWRGSSYYNGYMSNVRLIKGTALYTSNFTPSPGPLADVTNTKLLCCQSNTSASDAPVGGSVTAWLPSGFTYWTDGMSANWAGSGSTTSGTDDYINVALPTSGKYYFETSVNNIGVFRTLGIGAGASGAGSAYFEQMFGYYYNGNPPLFICHNSSGVSKGDAITHGASSGITQVDGGSLMWAWDADNDKVWLGYEGTWFGSGDPATGANPSISGEDLSASSFYLKLGYTADGGSLTLTNVASGDSGSTTVPTVNGDTVATNFNPFTDDINTVMGQETSYCTWNPLNKSTTQLLFNGALDVGADSDNWQQVKGTIGVDSGKYYWEISPITSTQINAMIGISDYLELVTTYPGDNSGYSYVWGGNKYEAGTYTASVGPTWVEGDVIGVALDCDGADQSTGYGTIKYYINNTLATTSTIPTDRTWWPAISVYYSDSDIPKYTANFGQKPFRFTPPEGHQILNYANLPSPEFVRPNQYVGVTTYTGTGAVQTVTGLNFQSDLIWIKSRTGVYNWRAFDSVRGFGSGKALYPDLDEAQGNNSGNDGALSTHDNGWTFTTTGARVNDATQYAAWCWKAGGSKGTYNVDGVGYASASDAGLTGAVNCTQEGASVGTKQGFSITVQEASSGSGDTMQIPHGLTQKPDFIIGKDIDTGSTNWGVYHSKLGAGNKMDLDSAAAVASNVNYWANTSPTSSLIYTNAASWMYTSSSFVLYAWHDVPGLQKFGSYTGLGVADGSFVDLGFRPAVVLVKCSSNAGQEWVLWDDERSKYNVNQTALYVESDTNESGAGVSRMVDFVSNGFKLRNGASGATDYSGRSYIYAAWAHQPMNNFYGAQSNAR